MAKETSSTCDFNLTTLKKHFESILRDERILIEPYILGYEELDKFICLLGTVFGWIATDLEAKIEILKTKRNSPDINESYDDVQTMVKQELSNKSIKFKEKDDSSGTRNLLRLHRALEFIIMFMESIGKLSGPEKCVAVAQEAYKKTLSRFHPWLIQKTALLAMHMLPTKDGLILKVCGDDPSLQEEAEKNFLSAIESMKLVYTKTQLVYEENNVLDLP